MRRHPLKPAAGLALGLLLCADASAQSPGGGGDSTAPPASQETPDPIEPSATAETTSTPARAAAPPRSPWVRQGALASREGRHWLAASIYLRVVQAQPNSANAHYLLGRALLAAGAPQTARRPLRAATRMRPGQAEYLSLLGWAQLRTGERRLARASFERALALDPKLPIARSGMAALENASRAARSMAAPGGVEAPDAQAGYGSAGLVLGGLVGLGLGIGTSSSAVCQGECDIREDSSVLLVPLYVAASAGVGMIAGHALGQSLSPGYPVTDEPYLTTAMGALWLGVGLALGASALDDAEQGLERARERARDADILMVTGGLTSAAGLLLIFTARAGEERSERRMSVRPLASPRLIGVAAGGRF